MFTYRIYKVTGKFLWTTVCGFLCLVRMGFGVSYGIISFQETDDILTFVVEHFWLYVTMLSVAAANDVIIAVTLTYHFIRHRSRIFTR